MGLDMYLHRKTYVKNWSSDTPESCHQIDIKLNHKEHPYIKTDKIIYIEEEVGYWRKANHIHKWFVENVQDGVDDCKSYYISWGKLEELLKTCKLVNKEKNLADTHLPTESGFFFGGTDYDDGYFSDILATIRILEPIVKYNKKINKQINKKITVWAVPEYVYQSSW